MRNGMVDLSKFTVSIILVLYHFYGATSEHWSVGVQLEYPIL